VIVDTQFLDRYTRGRFVVEILELFLDDAPRILRLLRASLDAGALTSAARSAHTLRGCAAHVGARALEERAAGIESAARAGDAEHARSLAKSIDDLAHVTAALLRDYCSGVQTTPL